MITAVAALAIGGTVAYFSDTETSTGNTFTAGTIDIAIDGTNPWTKSYTVGDLKPGETGYINFDISNVGANPVNVLKTLTSIAGTGGAETYVCNRVVPNANYSASSEPECVEENGTAKDDVASQIIYDLSVEVYNSAGAKIWWQSIYTDADDMKLTDVYGPDGGNYVALGMIPVGGHMKVTQSYHFSEDAGNEYQGDKLSFDITIKGDQLTQENGYAQAVLENKTGPSAWDVIQDDIKGTLSYKTNGSGFEYSFTGKAPLNDHGYVLAVGYDANTDVDKQIGTGTTDSSGSITISGNVNTGDLTNAKAWLVPTENWVGGTINWNGWPASASNFLWETGLINYDQN